MVNSIQKGKRGEREWRDVLRSFNYEARRGRQFSGSPESPDVICSALPFHHEVKLTETFNVYKALEQSKNDCGDKIPLVAHRRNGKDWVVCFYAQDFFSRVFKG